MKKIINTSIIILFITVTGFIIFKETEDRNKIPDFMLGQPFYDTIVLERRIHGKIMASEEIQVKSKINGIVEEVFVDVGQKVEVGQKIAVIRNLSEPMDIENLKSTINLYNIQLETAKVNLDREKKLTNAGLSTLVELEKAETEFNQLTEQLVSAKKRLQMATSGITTLDKELSNIVYAPASGTILMLYSKSGSPVIKQNNFSEGTTIASIADMNKLKYYGKIPESYLTEVYEGQEIILETLLDGKSKIYGKINKIYPKGNEEEGIVKFPIEASIFHTKEKLWAGINATAIITVARRDSVLCLQEKYLDYDNDSCCVYLQNSEGEFTKTALITGLSDGLKTEIIHGLSLHDKIKLPNTDN